jgi:hypothetical protein
LVKKYVNWTEGEKDCKNQGAHLASIHSAAENSFIHSLAPSNNLWIGGTDAAVEVVTHIVACANPCSFVC